MTANASFSDIQAVRRWALIHDKQTEI